MVTRAESMCLYKTIGKLKMENYVSVIIPAYNREKFILQSVESVLAQTWPCFELIVVDDGSIDRTAELVDRLRQKSDPGRIIYISQKNQGPAAARNAGIRAARYELIAFLDSDDRFVKDKLAAQVAMMAANPEALISHTDEIWFRRGVRLNPRNRHRKGGGDLFARCLELCVVGMSTVMVRRDFFARAGFFNEDFFCCEDYDLWLRASVELPFLYLDRPLTVKDGGRSDQLSVIHRLGMDKLRIKSIIMLLDSGRLDPQQEEAAIIELTRKCMIYGQGCLKHGRSEEGHYYLELPVGRQKADDRGQRTEKTVDRRMSAEQ